MLVNIFILLFAQPCVAKVATFVMYALMWLVVVCIVVCLLQFSTFGQIGACSLPSWLPNTNCHIVQPPVCRVVGAA